MLTGWSAITAILVMAVVTFALRALPFVLRRHRLIRALGRFLPAAILALLLIHTLVGFIRQDAPTVGAWPALVAILVTVGLQWRWHHALLSIFAGTGVYVLLRNAPMLF